MASALKINWSFGYSKDVVGGMHSLTNQDRNALFVISSHSGVIYDFEHRTQIVLQGHCNLISCSAVSSDKRWIVTADIGDDPILVVWDSLTGAPVKTIFSPHTKGVVSVDISEDSLYIVTLGEPEEDSRQEIAIWAWTREEETPILRHVNLVDEVQHQVRFDPLRQSEVVSTGKRTVCFWNWGEFSIEGYVGKVSKADLGSGKFTSTVFLAGTGNALTTTSEGNAILWETQFATVLLEAQAPMSGEKQLKTASKTIRLVDCSINYTTTTSNGYLVLGCGNGSVRFYDFFLRLESWFEDLSAGPVTSVSFAVQSCPFNAGEGGAPGLKFWAPDFMVGTSDAFIVGVEACLFDEVRPEDRRGTLLMQGMAEFVSSVACHPSRSLVAIACYNGALQVWDYDLKLLMNLREFNNRGAAASTAKPGSAASRLEARSFLRPQCAAFEPNGDFIAIGFQSGHIKFLNVDTFEDIASFAPTTDLILGMKFSASGIYLAAYDTSSHVMVFKKSTMVEPETLGDEICNDCFIYIGRVHSHSAAITGIEFGIRDGVETLVSVGEDRRVVEYDLEVSTVIDGLVSVDSSKSPFLDLNALPTAVMWHPHTPEDLDDRFVVANDEFKIKDFNVDSKQCRKSTIAPTFGGPLTNMLPITCNGITTHFAYSTATKVIGVGYLPLTGNPRNVMGLVAHPSAITCIAVSFDGKFLFSAGGADLSVNMWAIDTTAIGQDVEDMGSFFSLMEGGEGGALHNDIIDYFYYCQLRTQGEDAMEARAVTGTIPVEEIPSLMRAVGFYPSEEEVTNMVNEVRYKSFMRTGELINVVGLNDLIKLYLNHRPVLPLSNSQIASAFETLSAAIGGNNNGSADIQWKELKNMLISEGEAVASADLDAYLSALIGGTGFVDGTQFSAQSFANDVLGFEQGQ